MADDIRNDIGDQSKEASYGFCLMESPSEGLPLKGALMEQPHNLTLQSGSAMANSMSSSTTADTPGDSGVLCLDSDLSEPASDTNGFMTLSVAEVEEIACDSTYYSCVARKMNEELADMMTQSDIDNQNVTPPGKDSSMPEMILSTLPKTTDSAYRGGENLPDLVLKAHQTDLNEKCNLDQSILGELEPAECKAQKSGSDDIVFRRKCKKKTGQTQQKKRVSFHEDILNNTRTDNIHIERGLVSYNDNFDKGRYSWCENGMSYETNASFDRKIKSEVLTYGHTEVCAQPDNSGIYEYETVKTEEKKACKCIQQSNPDLRDGERSELYICSCNESDSNLSMQSDSSSSTQSFSLDSSDRTKENCNSYDPRKKSYSCDCIESENCKVKMHKMYFSEGDIAKSDLENEKHVEMKHVGNGGIRKSALKKKRYIPTNIVEEHSSQNKVDRNVTVNSRNIFGSLKSMYKTINFGLETTRRGLLEGTEDGESVLDVSTEIKLNENKIGKNMISFLSKSFDAGFYKDEAVLGEFYDDQPSYEAGDGFCLDGCNSSCQKEYLGEVSKPKLTLDVNTTISKHFVDWKSDLNDQIAARNKFIVNCESTVYEHKGLSYCYQHDAFQTAFDTVKEQFTPIKDVQGVKANVSSDLKLNSESDTPVPTNTSKIDNGVRSDNCPPDFSSSITTETTPIKTKNVSDLQEDNSKTLPKHLSSPLKQQYGVVRNDKYAFKSQTSDKIKNNIIFSNSNSNCDSVSTSLKDTSVDDNEVEETLEMVDATEVANCRQLSQKSSLINRFLKSVCQKKAQDAKLKNNEIYQKKLNEEKIKFPSLCLPPNEKISSTFKVSAKKVDRLIHKEIMENKRVSVKLISADEPSYFDSFEENVAMECCERLKLELFKDSSEILHRMLKVRTQYSMLDGDWKPLLVFITDKVFYVADVEPGRAVYNLVCYLPLEQLDTILVGPNSQYVQIIDTEKVLRCTLITGDGYLCHRLISSLEWSARVARACKMQSAVLFRDNSSLSRALAEATSGDTNFTFYGMVTLGFARDPQASDAEETSDFEGCEPPLEGYLMYKLEKDKQWKAGFFILKSGVFYYGMNTPKDRYTHSISLSSVAGVRRYVDPSGRPHCFEISQSEDVGNIILGAADDLTASMWLQWLLRHAAQALEGPEKNPPKEERLPPNCTLVTTTSHIITLREDTESWFKRRQEMLNSENASATNYSDHIEILSCASVKDLTAFKIPDCAENWCLLEFNVCEVKEQDAEMGIIFTSSLELERFISTVESLWHMTNEGVFPVSMSEGWKYNCSVAHSNFQKAWDYMLPDHR